jgi:hypothetical protein
MESLARLTDLCQAAASAVAAPTGSGGGSRSVSITRDTCFSLTCPAFRTFIHLISRMAKANNEHPLDRSSFRYVDSPPTARRVTWHAAPSGANRLPVKQLDDPPRPCSAHTIAASPILSFANTSVVPSRRWPSTIIRYSTTPSSLPIFATARRALGSAASALQHGL